MTKKNALITGGSGFVGQHMAALLLGRGHNVTCLQRSNSVTLPPGAIAIYGDLQDRDTLKKLPKTWNWVVHLAGESIPRQFKSSDAVLFNTALSLNLLEHLDAARVLLVSSCHVYAPSADRRTEDSEIIPQGRYGLSKHLLEQMAGHYQSKLDIRIARPFNHLGPHQRPELVIPSLLRRIRRSELQDQSPIVMKGTNSTRDFIDVTDVAAAYCAILEIERPNSSIFNVCTGEAVTIKQVVLSAFESLGIHREIVFEGHPNSEDDNSFVVGDASRLMSASTWKPVVSLRESLKRMLAAQD
jgi:GDP-4-dehydro-6-deoxy-D-mannose reductase